MSNRRDMITSSDPDREVFIPTQVTPRTRPLGGLQHRWNSATSEFEVVAIRAQFEYPDIDPTTGDPVYFSTRQEYVLWLQQQGLVAA